MATIFDYLTWRGDLSFSQSVFNPVDNIIFSQLSYLPFEDIVPGPGEKNGINLSLAMKILLDKSIEPQFSSFMFKEDPVFIKTLASSVRYGNCQLFGYTNLVDTDDEVQFSAICIYIDDDSSLIVFRGTDYSLVGWKEDFNMSFRDVIPAQLEAVGYLEKMARIIKGPFRICGHSKGGNLAIYAAANCQNVIQKRIKEIYSNDAPGFHENVIASEGFKTVKNRINYYVPQSSVIGMLLEHGCDYSVIKSSKIGLLQHELYSWEVTHNDMVYVDKTTSGSRFVDKTLKEWLGSLENEKRERFIEAIYSILTASEAKTLVELETTWVKSIGRIILSLGHIDEKTKKFIRETLLELFRSARHNIDTILKPESNE
jgi:hypothetical protein